jgi:NAD+ kinase
MKRIGVYSNTLKENKALIIDLLGNLLANNKLELYAVRNDSIFLTDKEVRGIKPYIPGTKLDCIMVFGGDGTILGAVDSALESSAPILGINMGKLGFLSDFSVAEFNRYIGRLMNDEYCTISRMLLEARVKKNSKTLYRGFALNDAVIYKGLVSRLIDIRFYSNKDFVLESRCDGMIASTPTGSTAYSLSAGGPIMSPEMNAFIVAPLCPHILSVRPMVFPAETELKFKMTRVFKETMLQLDGKNVHLLVDGDSVIVNAVRERVKFITLTGKNFYQTLRKKLHMGKM